MANRFSVTPAGNYGPGLSGLSNIIRENRMIAKEEAEKRQNKEALAERSRAIQEAYQSGDPNQVAQVAAQYPDISETIYKGFNITEEPRQRQLVSDLREVVSADIEQVPTILQSRIRNIQQRGGDPSETERLLADFTENPQQAMKEAQLTYAGLAPEQEYKAFQESMGGGDSRAAATELGKIFQDEQQGYLAPEQADLLREQFYNPAPEAADQRDRRINEYMDLFDMSQEEAVQAVDADIRLDERGNLISYNPVSGEGRLVDVDFGATPQRTPQPDTVDPEGLAFDPGKGTGFGAAFMGLWNSTVGQLPIIPNLGEDAEEVAQELRFLQRDALRALGSSGRPPVIEQERIAATLPQPQAWLENPEVARQKTASFVDLMMSQYVNDVRFAQDPRNARNQRDEARQRANNIQEVVNRVMQPEASEAMFRSLNQVEEEIGDIRTMDESELLEINVEDLTDAQMDVLRSRLMDEGE